MLRDKLTCVDDDLIMIAGNIYAKTPKALRRVKRELKALGYTIHDLRRDKFYGNRDVSIPEQERRGYSLWYATLKDIRFGKCNSCNQYISTSGIRSHGHTCEKCGEVTYFDIIEGSEITFSFRDKNEVLKVKAHRYDGETKHLYLNFTFLKGSYAFRSTLVEDAAWEYIVQMAEQGLCEIVRENNVPLIKIRYEEWSRTEQPISMLEIYGHYWNYKEVKVFNGQEYREWDRLPIPESVSINETWRWDPIKKSPTIHRKILRAVGSDDDKGWHYQDGRPWFTPAMWTEMAKFVRHFTDLDADAFDRAWPRFRSDGPGGIDDIARFCHEYPAVTDRPNMFNTINAFYNAASGRSLSRREVEAAVRGEQDPLAEELVDVMTKESQAPEAKQIRRILKAKNN